MGILGYAVAGGGFAVIGAWESLDSSYLDPNSSTGDDSSSPMAPQITPSPPKSSGSSSIPTALLSSLFIANSIYSFFSSIGSSDRVGSMLQLQILAVAVLFLVYAVVSHLVANSKNAAFAALPSSITTLLLLFGFIEEFLMFYLQKKDTSGIENRYYDLMLVPIAICVFSTLFDLRSDSNNTTHRQFAKLGRGIGLILQGTWFLQMGVSFFTGLITNNCSFHEKTRGNFTIKCRGHGDYHRAKAIATLQFNCHLALMVVLATALFSVVANRKGYLREEDHSKYRPLGAEMENLSNFTLDSDEEEDEVGQDSNLGAKETGVNGIISSHA
ncbi:hypothetical protein Rs2_19420 [Raphanus sativus]|uniref:Uncharacterized protein LOC108861564 n=1 Tax=Raphanus sativus TaxID=3726 RepID=A0A6J0P1P2_RAPSA|nr:uncharacterized protein LOC108861564 [Raphanus sativus]KAJ4892626.1 hypothetical protein Rs2_19420 [Raphanus sativus]